MITMNKYTHKSEYFYGNKISDYGLEHGYVDYCTLAQAFDAVMNNEIVQKTCDIGFWEPVGGSEYYYEDKNGHRVSRMEYDEMSDEARENLSEHWDEVFQWFIVSERGAEILQDLTDEILYYNETLDMYVWGVTHWGTSWDYVLTDIRIALEDDDEAEH